MASREYDLVIFGATGDAGRAMATLLAETAPPSLRWTIAGRSTSKLEVIRANSGRLRLDQVRATGRSPPAACGDISVADCADDAALRALAGRTRVLISAAGPYSVLGERVLLACIQAQTHYVDITGEVPWVTEMRRRHDGAAAAAGVCVASFCGYDCVPGELSLYLARQALGGPLSSAESVLVLEPGSDGGAPRGTLLTTLTLMHDTVSFLRGLVGFVPSEQRFKMLASLLCGVLPHWSRHVRAFTLPHFMCWCNVPIMHASAACIGGAVPGASAGVAGPSTTVPTAVRRSEAAASATTMRFRDAMLLPYADRWLMLWGLLPLVLVYLALPLLAPLWLLLAVPPVKRAARRLLLGSYSYAGSRAARTRFRTRAVAAVDGACPAAQVELVLPGDGGIYATALLALTCGRAMLDVLDGHAKAYAGQTTLPAGLCTPVEALGDALVARLRGVPGVQLEIQVESSKKN